MKEVNLKRLSIVQFQIYFIVDKAKKQHPENHQWQPGIKVMGIEGEIDKTQRTSRQ